jgi:hypothetical protein
MAPIPFPCMYEALAAPLRAFPSWFLRIECARRGREKYMAETHAMLAGRGDRIIGEIIERMRHDGCGGQVRSGWWSCSPASPAPAGRCGGSC